MATKQILISLVIAISGCSKTPPVQRAEDPHKEHRQIEFLRDTSRIEAGKSRSNLDVVSYFLKGRFDWERARLFAVAEITLRQIEGNTIELDSNVEKISSVSLLAGGALSHTVDTTKGKLVIELGGIGTDTEITIVIQYEVQANSASIRARSKALFAVAPRAGDPVSARVVSTFSEPEGASYWLPCHDVPSDRAHFSTEFWMPAGERLISNGDLEIDEVAQGERHMKYATRYGIPTYLMAFSQGEFELATRYHGNLPVSLWVRRGLPVDYKGMLESIVKFVAAYEKLMGPYPFEKYATVLLPEFTGGIEHAGITFQGETTSTQSQLSSDLGLTAHELGHQWFGDYVTVATWDDLWIKEGMATLLAEEATRYFEDTNHSGRLFGSAFFVESGDAIRDPELPPDDKYTSGPYGRAAWLLTQIRNRVGESQFWEQIRRVLSDHAFGTIGTDEFISYFRPYLGEKYYQAVVKALAAKELPEVKLTNDSITLTDSEGALVNPVDYRFYDSNGTYTQGVLGENPITLDGSKLLALDSSDQHPIQVFEMETETYLRLVREAMPSGEKELAVFQTFAPNQMDFALDPRAVWSLQPQEFSELYSSIPSDFVKYKALQMACSIAKTSENVKGWKEALEHIVLNPPYRGMSTSRSDVGLSGCEGIVGEVFFPRLQRLKHSPDDTHFDEAELVLLSSIPADPGLAFSAWTGVVERGRSVRARIVGLNALSRYLRKLGTFSFPETISNWTGFLHNTIENSGPSEIQFVGLQMAKDLKDKTALRAIAQVTKRAFHPRLQRQAVCTAHAISGADTEAWNGYVKNLDELTELPELVQELVANPTACG